MAVGLKPFELTVPYPLTLQVAGGDYTFDLPNEPFSYLDFIVSGIADTAVTSELSVADVLSQIDLISIRLNGADVLSLTGEEIAIYALAVQGYVPVLTFEDDAVNQAYNLTFRLPFSRKAYDRTECYPATPSGNSQCRVQNIAIFTKVDSMYLEVVACRLPDATPTKLVTVDRIVQAIAAVGAHDIQLTVQFPYVGLLMQSQYIPNALVLSAVIRYLSLYEDSDQTRLHDIPWGHVHGNLVELMRTYGWLREHTHLTPVTPAVAGARITGQVNVDDNLWDHFGYVDFDPTRDGSNLLNVPRDHNLLARVVSDIIGDAYFYPIILRDCAEMLRR